jgi:hypothetical protein
MTSNASEATPSTTTLKELIKDADEYYWCDDCGYGFSIEDEGDHNADHTYHKATNFMGWIKADLEALEASEAKRDAQILSLVRSINNGLRNGEIGLTMSYAIDLLNLLEPDALDATADAGATEAIEGEKAE